MPIFSSESTRASDPRITQANRRIEVIEARIEDERRKAGCWAWR